MLFKRITFSLYLNSKDALGSVASSTPASPVSTLFTHASIPTTIRKDRLSPTAPPRALSIQTWLSCTVAFCHELQDYIGIHLMMVVAQLCVTNYLRTPEDCAQVMTRAEGQWTVAEIGNYRCDALAVSAVSLNTFSIFAHFIISSAKTASFFTGFAKFLFFPLQVDAHIALLEPNGVSFVL